MPERRAADGLWLALRDAVVTLVSERRGEHVLINRSQSFSLRLQKGRHFLDLEPRRDAVICTMRFVPDPEPDRPYVIHVGLHPGKAPSFELYGELMTAERAAEKLLVNFVLHAT